MWEFLRMGGYGAYVWASYGATTAMFVGFAVFLWQRKKRLAKRQSDD